MGSFEDEKNKIDIDEAANQGDKQAQFELGEYLAALDDPEAYSWFLKAAEQGHVGAQFQIAEMYANGYYQYRIDGYHTIVAKNMTMALEWYRRVAASGHKLAQLYVDLIVSGRRT
jgi:TPR repeat protein